MDRVEMLCQAKLGVASRLTTFLPKLDLSQEMVMFQMVIMQDAIGVTEMTQWMKVFSQLSGGKMVTVALS